MTSNDPIPYLEYLTQILIFEIKPKLSCSDRMKPMKAQKDRNIMEVANQTRVTLQILFHESKI